MSIGSLFWVIMILALLSLLAGTLGFLAHGVAIAGLVQWVLLALLGWKVFGPMLRQ